MGLARLAVLWPSVSSAPRHSAPRHSAPGRENFLLCRDEDLEATWLQLPFPPTWRQLRIGSCRMQVDQSPQRRRCVRLMIVSTTADRIIRDDSSRTLSGSRSFLASQARSSLQQTQSASASVPRSALRPTCTVGRRCRSFIQRQHKRRCARALSLSLSLSLRFFDASFLQSIVCWFIYIRLACCSSCEAKA